MKLAGAARRRNATGSASVVAQSTQVESSPHLVDAIETAGPDVSLRTRLQALIVEAIENGDAGIFEFFEQTLIHTAFNFCTKNQVQTAKLLGISRNILRTHLKHHGLIGPEAETGHLVDDSRHFEFSVQ